MTEDIPTLKVYEQMIYYGSMIFWGAPFVLKIIHKKAMIELLIEQTNNEKKYPIEVSSAQLLSTLYPPEKTNDEPKTEVEKCLSCKKLGLVVWQKRCKFCNSVVKLEYESRR